MKYSGLIFAALLTANSAVADTELTMSQSGSDDDSTTVISVHKGKVALSDDGVVQGIYDASSGTFTQLDHSSKSYMTIDGESMNQMADQVSAMIEQAQAQMANMPEAQREAMMKMMPADIQDKLRGNTGKKASADIDWTGVTEKVAGYACKVATVTTSAGKTSSACVAKADALGISPADFDAMAAMLDTMQEMAARFGSPVESPSARQLGGVPIRMTGEGQTTLLQSINNDKLDGALFEIPAGYNKRSMMDGM